MYHAPHTFNGPRALRALIHHEPIVRCLGAHDVLTARLVEHAGIECIFIGGFGCSASQLGVPDMNLLTLSNITDAARRAISAVEVPVIVDGDTGHGDLHNVQRTVQLFEQIGAAGILLEDQVVPKRCGHFEGKQVIPAKEMVLKIHAALDVRENPDLVLIARTDARANYGLEEAIERACMYAEAGADVCYVEAPESDEELAIIPGRLGGHPVMANMLTGGRTPSKSVDELQQLGFRMALWPIETVLVTGYAVERLTRQLITHGRIGDLKDEMMTFQEIQDLLGLPELLRLRERIERRAGMRS